MSAFSDSALGGDTSSQPKVEWIGSGCLVELSVNMFSLGKVWTLGCCLRRHNGLSAAESGLLDRGCCVSSVRTTSV